MLEKYLEDIELEYYKQMSKHIPDVGTDFE